MSAIDESLALSGSVYFLTTDLDRANEAADLAESFGLTLRPLFPKERERLGQAAAAVIDLDYLCLDAAGLHREVAELLAAPPALPLVLLGHGEYATEEPARDGIAWFSTLSDAPFDWLARQFTPGAARLRVRDLKEDAA
jgi:hypothetical protein